MLKNRVLIQYTILSLIIISAATILHGFILGHRATDYFIKMHIGKFQDAVNIYTGEYPSTRLLLISDNHKTPVDGKSITKLSEILSRMGAFRVKLWDKHQKLLWCNACPVGGKNRPCYDEYSGALSGTVTYKIERANKAGASGRDILKIFIPVSESGKITGVIEIHKQADQIELTINKNLSIFWIIILSTDFVLFISLFFIFFRANRSHSVILKRLEQTQDVTIFALAYQAELRDNETGKHLDRTASYVRLLVEELRNDEKYSNYLTARYVSDLVKAAPLHDIGKVGIPDSILRKPGSLTPEEFAIIKNHCQYGVEVLEKASSRLTVQSFLDIAIQLVGSHHERWNGSGYPKGLSKSSIPVSGRIMALADVYDALRSRRVYKDPFPHDTCVKIISDESGKHFDPVVVKAFIAHEQEFLKISELMED